MIKVHLNNPVHSNNIEVYLADITSQGFVFEFKPFPLILEKKETTVRGEPTFCMYIQQLMQFQVSLQQELQRHGFIKPDPSEIEVQLLKEQLAFAHKSIDNLLMIMHRAVDKGKLEQEACTRTGLIEW